MRLREIYTIRVIYKSGASQEFEASLFTIANNECTWTAVGHLRPILIGLDDISSVWTICKRLKLVWK